MNDRTLREEYFARIEPLLGRGLQPFTLELEGVRACARAVEMLAACRLSRIRTRHPIGLRTHLRWKNGFRPARVLAPGRGDARLEGRFVPVDQPCSLEFTVEGGRPTVRLTLPRRDVFAQAQANGLAARWILDGLTGKGWPTEGRLFVGQRAWPWSQTRQPGPRGMPTPRPSRRRHVLLIGLGSLGSEAARLLRGPQLRWTLVDPGPVKIHNPIRQWYASGEIGQRKVDCLARRLRAPVRKVAEKLEADGERLRALIAEDRPDLVLLCAGTAEHADLAATLWQDGLPHVSVLAYPRARFFEVTAVSPAERTPCLDCYRGRLDKGPAARLPLDEELSSFLYTQVPEADRERVGRELVAEPATPMDTGRIAEVAARVAAELLLRPARRAPWMTRMFAEQTTCLLGGNAVETTDDGGTAYGLTYVGQVVRLGLDDIAGVEAVSRCAVCGRDLITAHRLQAAPEAEDVCSASALNAALLDA